MKNTLLNIIENWVNVNKKFFWKYEVASYYPTYNINIANMPLPSEEDIRIKSSNRVFRNSQMLNYAKKTQLCKDIKKACPKSEVFSNPNINVQIDYIKGTIIIEFI